MYEPTAPEVSRRPGLRGRVGYEVGHGSDDERALSWAGVASALDLSAAPVFARRTIEAVLARG